MADFTPGQIKLLNYWGEINASVEQEMTTAQVWGYVKDAAAAEGFDLAGANAIDMGKLRSLAAANRNASRAFMAAPANTELGAVYFGRELYAPAAHEINLEPVYLVRFEQGVLENGMPARVWRTDSFRGLLPPTKDELMQRLESDAQLIGDEYNQTHVSIGDVRISIA
jgi:hypothetical protein